MNDRPEVSTESVSATPRGKPRRGFAESVARFGGGFTPKGDDATTVSPELERMLEAQAAERNASELKQAMDDLAANTATAKAVAPEGASPSIADLVKRTSGQVTAARLAIDLLEAHRDYASALPREELLRSLSAPPARQRTDTAAGWVNIVRELFVSKFVEGRRAIIALGYLEPWVGGVLARHRFKEAITREIVLEERRHTKTSQPRTFGEMLTSEARAAFGLADLDEDAVQTRSDAPADKDMLFRWPFAEGLALRIRSMRRADAKPRPLMLLLDGPWGSGKSTVMGFVASLLQDPRIQVDGAIASGPAPARRDRWIPIRYNAWQHQRMEAPWWSLANVVITQAIGEERRGGSYWNATKLFVRHHAFRLLTGRLALLIGAGVTIGIGVALYRYWRPSGTSVGFFKDLATILTVVFGVAVAAARFLGGGGSQDYLTSRPDPMGSLEKHLREALCGLDRPVIVLVDDIDRCEAPAVVKLLEGVQILFGSAPVVFLVAGDQRWIQRSFETIYEKFTDAVGDGSRKLGASFLEKTFQIAIWLPEPIEEGRERYWRHLLGLRAEAEQPFTPLPETLGTEEDVVHLGREVEGSGDIGARLQFRRQAVQRLAEPDIEREIESHTLAPIYKFVEPNPRAMKRLVMAYGLARTVDVLSGRYSPSTPLALWTVVGLRWPQLAAWLREDPTRLLWNETTKVDDDEWPFVELLVSNPVRRVLNGPPGGPGLDKLSLQAIIGAAA